MEFDFIPYDFKCNLSKFRRELLLIGVTYYERLLVFEHLNKPIDQVLYFPVTSIELGFNKEEMVSVWILLEKCLVDDLLDTFESHQNKKATEVIQGEFDKIENKLLYRWEDDTHLLGIGLRESINQLFIYFTLKEFSLY